jgi:hypothetical protein
MEKCMEGISKKPTRYRKRRMDERKNRYMGRRRSQN